MESRHDAGFEELCPVCGDKVSGYHYGLLTCESCKGFFKRTVQNDKKYTCVNNQQCRIDKAQRRRCPFCRFQKCLRVGMRLEAVRADRMRGGRNKFGHMYKHDRALKQWGKALKQATRLRPDISPIWDSSPDQRDLAFAGGPHPTANLHSTPLTTDKSPPPSSLLPSSSPFVSQYQFTYPSDLTIKSEYNNNWASSTCPIATICTDSNDLYSRYFSVQGPRTPQLVLEFLHCDPDELQLRSKIIARLQQEQTGWETHRDPETFSLMCTIADQMLCSIVEWARTSIFFRQLKVSDQMKLLHHGWSELLLLNIISRQILYGKEGSLLLVTGQEVELSDIVFHAGPALASLTERGQKLVEKLHILKVDRQEFSCIKFFILFNPDVKELEDHGLVKSVQEQVERALLEYTLTTSSQYLSRFVDLLLCLSELRSLSTLMEDYLNFKHLSGEMPCNNLLSEMLHAKRA